MPCGLGGVIELDRAEEIAVIGHADGGHVLRGDDLHQLVDFAGAIEQGIVGVVVEVDEGVSAIVGSFSVDRGR